jgi:hypothetical protein
VTRQRQIGAAMMSLGVVVLLIAAFLTFNGDDGEVATATTRASTSTTTARGTTTLAGTTTVPSPTTSTSAPTTTTTTTAPTTTTRAPLGAADAEAFVAVFAAAIADDDVDFLFDRLHPVVRGMFDDDLCRSFIEREILALVDYRATGAATSRAQNYTVGGEAVVVDPLFEVPILFSFQGQEFDGIAALAEVDGEMRWFTQCR